MPARLQREGEAVGHIIAVQAAEEVGKAGKHLPRKTAPPDHDGDGEGLGKEREDKEQRGGDEFRPEEAVDARGEREHQIALVGQEILVEALDHQNGGEDRHAEECQHKGDDEQGVQNVEEERGRLHMTQDQIARGNEDRKQQHRAEQRSHQAARGAEFMFDQFSQHLNTSRNSASTDLPRFSRIPSQLS